MKYKVFTIFVLSLFGSGYVLPGQVTFFQEVSTKCGISDVYDMTDMFGNGASAADFDNDGDVDFYLATDEGITDRLYQNDGYGNFTDIALEVGIIEEKSSRTALWFDYNGDHRLDLAIAGENCVGLICENPVHLVLYKQLEDGTFVDVSVEAGFSVGSYFDNISFYGIGGLASADLNQDDFLDFILTVWGGGIKYLQNNGDGTFSDKTTEANLILEHKTPWQPMLHDFNKDGWIDIYCNVDFDDNKLWINQGGVFEEKGEEYGMNTAFNEMGMTMGDYDNDGDLDIYMTNITRDFQGQPQYNVLLKQEKINGQIKFRNIGQGQAVSQSGWDWGTTFIDINNNGRLDLIATNGWWDKLTYDDDRSNLWLNSTAGFVDVSDKCGFNDMLDAASLLAFDVDRDGDLDILQTLKDNESTDKPVHIYENKLEDYSSNRNYINIKPRMAGANHFAIGSTITVVADELISSRLISAGCSFYGQEPAEAFFGLGNREQVKEVIIKWSNSEISIYQDLRINETNTLDYDYIKPPTNLTSTLNSNQIDLSWKDNSVNETGFVLHKSEDSIFTEYTSIILDANATSYTDLEVNKDRNQFYRVRAFKPNVLSDNSNVAGFELAPKLGTGIFIHPNPVADNNLTVKIHADYRGEVQFSFFDLSGKRIWSEKMLKDRAFETFKFTIEVPSGLYLLGVKMGGSEEWHKVIAN